MRDEVPGMDGLADETRAYLTRQQRYLLLAEPIARLSFAARQGATEALLLALGAEERAVR
jgi:hypothetical protein